MDIAHIKIKHVFKQRNYQFNTSDTFCSLEYLGLYFDSSDTVSSFDHIILTTKLHLLRPNIVVLK
jgi:hypothetical protein